MRQLEAVLVCNAATEIDNYRINRITDMSCVLDLSQKMHDVTKPEMGEYPALIRYISVFINCLIFYFITIINVILN